MDWAENAHDNGWPTTKLSAPPVDAVSCLLLTTGAMNPVHRGHVGMLQAAADRARAAGYHVLGSFISPSHDGYVQPKAASLGTFGLSARFRLEVARRAVVSVPLVAVASWEADFVGSWPDFPVVCSALQAQTGGEVRVLYVCGTDHATKCGLWKGTRKFGVIVVPRPGEAVCMEMDNVLVSAPAAGDAASFSSTKLREAIRKRDEAAVLAFMGAPEAAALVLRPSAAEHEAYASDFEQIGILRPVAPPEPQPAAHPAGTS